MNSKKLPITIPPIIGYTVHAYPLSIIYSYEECLPWFFSNYIQLVCNTQFTGNFFDFFSLCGALEGSVWIDSIYPGVPWINRHSVEGFVISDCNLNIHNLITASLEENNYIVSYLDEFFVPNRKPFQKEQVFHENLVYGYDTYEMAYDILGFDDKGVYRSSRISFDAFEQAFKSSPLRFSYNTIKLLKVRQDYLFELDLELIRDSLLDYIYSRNSSTTLRMIRNPTKNCAYGISIYDVLIKYFESLSNGMVDYDIRPLHLLWEHKKCMLLRMEFISKNYLSVGLNDIYNDYMVVEQKCLSLRDLFIKYYISKQPSIINKIILGLRFIREKEQEILPNLITKIEGLI